MDIATRGLTANAADEPSVMGLSGALVGGMHGLLDLGRPADCHLDGGEHDC